MAAQQYNNPGTTASSIGAQARTDYYEKKRLLLLEISNIFLLWLMSKPCLKTWVRKLSRMYMFLCLMIAT